MLVHVAVTHPAPAAGGPGTMRHVKRIALVAHDHRKQDLLEWAAFNRAVLAAHALYATAATGRPLRDALGLEVTALHSGPLGGDQQIGGPHRGGGDRRMPVEARPQSST